MSHDGIMFSDSHSLCGKDDVDDTHMKTMVLMMAKNMMMMMRMGKVLGCGRVECTFTTSPKPSAMMTTLIMMRPDDGNDVEQDCSDDDEDDNNDDDDHPHDDDENDGNDVGKFEV